MAYFDLSNKEFNKEKSSKSKIWGIILVALCSIMFLILLTNFLPFLQNFLLGVFGLFAYPFSIVTFAIGIALINNKKYVMPFKYVIYLAISIVCVLALLNIIILGNPASSLLGYLGLTYSYKFTGGGILIGLLVAPLIKTLGLAGSVIIFSIVLIIFVALIIDFLNSIKIYGFKVATENKKEKDLKIVEVVGKNEQKPAPIKQEKPITEKEQFNLFLDKKLEEQQNNDAKIRLGLMEGNLDSKKSAEKPKSIKEHLLTPPQIDLSYFNATDSQEKRQREISKNIATLKQENPNNHFKIKENLALDTDIETPVIEENNTKFEYEKIIENNNVPPENETTYKNIFEKPKKTFAQLQIEGTKAYTPPELKNVYRKPPIITARHLKF